MGTQRMTRLGIVGVLAFVVGLSPPLRPSTAAGEGVAISWTVHERTLADGRTYFVQAPTCAPADALECRRFLGRKRALVVWLHGAGGAEDRDTATSWLGSFHGWSPDSLLVAGVSKDGTRRWDAGICCTSTPVDDVGYLAAVVNDVAAGWAVDRDRVGALGVSNGGMMAARAACARPRVFAAAASLAGTYAGSCDTGTSRVGQWHGALDDRVPLNGGSVWVAGGHRTFPPAAALAERMAVGSSFVLRVRPGAGHALPWADYRKSFRWLMVTLVAG